MSIIQISKIQQRSGDLVDLPQLDEAELGFATDERRLFIGKTSGFIENVEVLTAYSDIAFSQINGAIGNTNISTNVENGQLFVFDGTNWVNRGGNAGGYINLGDLSDISIEGGSIGYQLTTDGVGNLSWSPKGFVDLPIMKVTNTNPAILHIKEPYPLTGGIETTINLVQGNTGFTDLNANVFYLKPIANTVTEYEMYTDSSLLQPYNATGVSPAYPFTSVVSTASTTDEVLLQDSTKFLVNQSIIFKGDLGNSGIIANTVYYVYSKPDTLRIKIATSNDSNIANIVQLVDETTITANVFCASAIAIIDVGGGGAEVGGVNTQVQFNFNSSLAGDNGLTYDFINTVLTANNLTVTNLANIANLKITGPANIVGNANVTNITASGNIGTAGNITVGGNIALMNNLSAGGTVQGGTVKSKNITVDGASTGNLNVATITGNLGLRAFAATYTDNVAVANSTISNAAIHAISASTMAATNANVTATNGSTLFIQGPPAAGTNMTITNRYSLFVSSGNTYLNGTANITGAANVGSLSTTGAITATGTITGGNLITTGSANTVTLNVSGKTNLNAVGNITITGGSNNQILRTDGAGNLTWTDPTGGYYLHSQSVASTTWTVTHNLNRQYVTVEPINSDGNSYTGRYDFPTINYTNANALTMTFTTAQAGWAAVTGGGINLTTGGGGGTGIPGGVSTQVQFNDAGTFGGSSGLLYDKSTYTLTANNITTIGKSNLNNISNVYIGGGAANQVLKTDGAGNLSWVNPTGGYYLHTQSTASTTWTIVHNLNNQYVNVDPVDNTGNSYAGRYDYPTINYTNANAVTLTFSSAVAGWCSIVGGGFTYVTGQGTGTTNPGGLNSYVQFNDNGVFGGQASLSFNKATGTLSAINFAGSGANLTNIPGANITGSITASTAGTVTSANQPNITSLGTLTSLTVSGALTTTQITAGANTTAGTITGNWTLTSGSQLQSTYADLAEYYAADQAYETGTVLEFGGDKEVTLASVETNKIAGVVSTNPSYIMNSDIQAEFPVALALIGRAPVKVKGLVSKGDIMVSAGDGFAKASSTPVIGTVLGKAIENKSTGGEGVIEVLIGRI